MNNELYLELVDDIWHVYTMGITDIKNDEVFAPTVEELCAKLTGMHRVITIMRDYTHALTDIQAKILRDLIRDCRIAAKGTA